MRRRTAPGGSCSGRPEPGGRTRSAALRAGTAPATAGRAGAGRAGAALAGTALALAALAVALLAGCGVPLEADAQRLPADAVPPAASVVPTPASTPPAPPTPIVPSTEGAAIPVRLWFVGDGGLEAVPVLVPASATAETLLELLAAGPTGSAAGRGLRTVVSDPTGAGALVAAPEPTPGAGPAPAVTATGVETVRVSEAFAVLPPAEQVLVLGQVVLTLTDAGAEAVQVTDAAGTPLAVPLPDGRLLDRPATAADYSSLIATD